MFSMAQNSHMTSILNNPKLLFQMNLGPIPYPILKFEVCILLFPILMAIEGLRTRVA